MLEQESTRGRWSESESAVSLSLSLSLSLWRSPSPPLPPLLSLLLSPPPLLSASVSQDSFFAVPLTSPPRSAPRRSNFILKRKDLLNLLQKFNEFTWKFNQELFLIFSCLQDASRCAPDHSMDRRTRAVRPRRSGTNWWWTEPTPTRSLPVLLSVPPLRRESGDSFLDQKRREGNGHTVAKAERHEGCRGRRQLQGRRGNDPHRWVKLLLSQIFYFFFYFFLRERCDCLVRPCGFGQLMVVGDILGVMCGQREGESWWRWMQMDGHVLDEVKLWGHFF